MEFFSTFRGRLLLILAFLLIATLGLQYFLNLKTQRENAELREKQEQALVAAISLGFASIAQQDFRLRELLDQPNQTFLDEDARRRVLDILIIDNEWDVYDALNPDYLPTTDDNGDINYRQLRELTDLPPMPEEEALRLGEDIQHFPNASSTGARSNEAHAIPIETSKGRWYVMVLLRNDRADAEWRAAQPLVYMLGILLISTLVTFYLVWRFTRPVSNLANAAKRVAEGDLSVRVPDDSRSDEMGKLAKRFNEMTRELEKAHELESQLQQAEKSAVIGRLGSAIAHEIRNPLNYINLTLDHLRSKFAPEDEEKRTTFDKLTTQLKTEVARINQQISDFLNYSRPAKADLRPVELRKIVDDSLRLIEAETDEKHINLSLVEHEDVPMIEGDPETLRSVFNNLFINAMQAIGPEGGGINVRISPDEADSFVRVEVSDTGYGITPENIDKVFEPYFSTKETGTGLGLAIVQKIIEMHRGTIEVESELGKGTRFTVKLPKA